jgi:predicted DCC family thiol-disulfide oxidoreductase YuxK
VAPAALPDLVLYDGACAVCRRLAAFVSRRDRRGRLHFAPLAGEEAARAVAPYGIRPAGYPSVLVLADRGTPRERLLDRALASLHVVRRMPWPWRALAGFLVLPRGLLDRLYDGFARNRGRIPVSTCAVPSPK